MGGKRLAPLIEQKTDFDWQKGYAALSVSPSQVDGVRAYILNQEEHHRKRTFDQEFLALLEKARIGHDARDVFVG